MADLPRGLLALGQRPFRLIWFSLLIAHGGYWLSYVCLQLLIVRLTHGEPLGQTLLVVCGFAPQLVLSPLGGLLADRIDRVRMMMAIHAVYAALAATLTLVTVLRFGGAAAVYLIAFGFGIAMAFYGPVSMTIAGQAVTRVEMPSAMALQQVAQQAARMVGPVLAIPVVLVGGPKAAFAGYTVAALLTIPVLMRVRLRPYTRATHSQSMLAQLRGGYQHARERPPALLLLSIVAVASLFTATYPNVLVPIVATTVLHQGPDGFFVLIAAVGGGAAAGALLSGFLVSRPRPAVAALEMAAMGLAVAMIGVAPGYLAVLAGSALYGALFFALMATAASAVQQLLEEASRGRVMSLYVIAWGGLMPFGAALAGGMAHYWGARNALLLLGGATVAYAGAVAWKLRAAGRSALLAAAADGASPGN